MLCYRCGSHVPDGSPGCGTCGQTFASAPKRGGAAPKAPRKKSVVDIPGAYQIGERIAGRYTVQAVLGQGPIGVVYRALDREVEVQVAVKVVTPKLLQTAEERDNFRREVRLTRALAHPNIVRVYDEGLEDDRPYVVMQHLEGLSLRKIIDLRHGKGQRFTLKELEPIFSQLAAALDHAHGQGERPLAHGNLKPENVIVLPDLLKVTDFREAAYVPRVPFVAAQKVRGGSERYLAPELVSGHPITPAADLWALGVLLGEMLTGEVYDTNKGLDLHLLNTVLPRAVDGIFKRLVAPRPEDRYEQAGHVADDLAAVIAGALPEHAGLRDARISPSPSSAVRVSDEPEPIGSGDFELLDEEPDSTSNERPASRVMFGLDGPPPAPPEAFEDALDFEDEDQGFEDEDQGFEDEEHESGGLHASDLDEVYEDEIEEEEPFPGTPVEMPTDPTGFVLEEDLTAVPGADATDQRLPVLRPRAPREASSNAGVYLGLALFGILGGVGVALVYTGQGAELWERFLGGAPDPLEQASSPAPGEPPRVEATGAAADEAPPKAVEVATEAPRPPLPEPLSPEAVKAAPPKPTPSPEVATPAEPRAPAPVVKRPPKADPPPPRAPPVKAIATERPEEDEGRKVAAVTPSPAESSRCPGGMSFVPGGPFKLGSAINDPMRNFAERTLADVDVPAFCVDRYEHGGEGRVPATNVTWYQAKAQCEQQDKRLCSEEEWEKACKGPRNLRFPYGNVFDAGACNTEDADGNDRSVARGGAFSRCRSGYGTFDMAGNVAEWTASKFQSNVADRTQKGGAADRPDWDTRCSTRANRAPNTRDRYLGFRCCADPR